MKNKRRGITLRSSALAFAIMMVMSVLPIGRTDSQTQAEGLITGAPSLEYFDGKDLENTFGVTFYSEKAEGAGEIYQRVFEGVYMHHVRKIVICLDMSEASSNYSTELPETVPSGVEKIGEMSHYSKTYGKAFVPAAEKINLDEKAPALKYMREIRTLCRENQVELTVIMMPLHRTRLEAIGREQIIAYKKSLSSVCDFWDFSVSDISSDMRYFASKDTARFGTYNMVLQRIIGDEKAYLPENFGLHITRANADRILAELDGFSYEEDDSGYTKAVPILLYHNITDKPRSRAEVTPETFRRNMETLKKHGYTAVSAKEMIDFVKHGSPLPEKPILITIDDGYLSNYQTAYPILKELGLKAVIFPIGVSIGKDTYKDTGIHITPHFTKEQAKRMEASGVIEIQSHTYDMHMWGPYEKGTVRETADQLKTETAVQYAEALVNDFRMYQSVWDEDFYALAYPKGRYTEISEKVFHSLGIDMTVSTTTDMKNVLVKGQPQSLYALCRYDIADGTTEAQLLQILSPYNK